MTISEDEKARRSAKAKRTRAKNLKEAKEKEMALLKAKLELKYANKYIKKLEKANGEK